jgi:hypothetical protein
MAWHVQQMCKVLGEWVYMRARCKYFLIVIGRQDVDRTNNAYRTLLQSTQNGNYIGQNHYL